MGEVYRAEDLTLGQLVAMKFLPEAMVRDEEWLTRFRNEVRAARQVSHPNVCRVYDIGEADGQTFLTMEFIQGEDLASLLRRIGRLAPDKAAGVAAIAILLMGVGMVVCGVVTDRLSRLVPRNNASAAQVVCRRRGRAERPWLDLRRRHALPGKGRREADAHA